MVSKRLIEQLVKLAEQEDIKNLEDSFEQSEDVPIEYFELKDFARRRLLLRKSLKIHVLIFIIINGMLFHANWISDPNPEKNIFHFWVFIPILIWGLLLWIHGVFVITNNIKYLMGTSLQRKIFIITALILVYIMIIAPIINHLVNVNVDVNDEWWYYVEIAIAILLFIYWYALKQIDDEKMNERILKEIGKIKKEYGSVVERIMKRSVKTGENKRK